MINKKVIFILVNEGVSARYFFHTNLYNLLNAYYKVIVLTKDKKVLEKNFLIKNSLIENYSENFFYNSLYFIYDFFRQVRILTFFDKKNHFSNYWRKFYFKSKNSLKKRIFFSSASLLSLLTSNIFLFHLLFNKLESYLVKKPNLFIYKKYNPDYLFTTSLGCLSNDAYFIHEAKKLNVKHCALILSWDNTTTKGPYLYYPDKVVAWTQLMKNELINFHRLNENKIFISGPLFFDYHKSLLRNKIIKSPTDKTIFLALESPTTFKNNIKLLKYVIRSIEKLNKIKLIVRLHPLTFKRDHNNKIINQKLLNDINRIVKEYNFIELDCPHIIESELSCLTTINDSRGYVERLYKSDILIAYFSTLFLEASLFDIPCINISLASRVNLHYKDLMNFYHNARVNNTGAITYVYNQKELDNAIKMYLNNPKQNQKNRKELVNNECEPNIQDSVNKFLELNL